MLTAEQKIAQLEAALETMLDRFLDGRTEELDEDEQDDYDQADEALKVPYESVNKELLEACKAARDFIENPGEYAQNDIQFMLMTALTKAESSPA